MKLTKRLLSLSLAMIMALSLAACGGGDTTTSTPPAQSGAPTSAAPAAEAVYNTLYASEVTTLNYLVTGTTNELTIATNVVDCLVEYDSHGNIEPALATEWSQNDDATVWTFKIREGVKWVDKDGNEVADVTAHDWVSAIQYVCDANNDSATQYLLTRIAGADAYYEWTAYQMALATAKDGTDENGNPVKLIVNEDGEEEILEEVPEARLEDIGVKALNDYTLEFTLGASCPFFLSTVSFGPMMPVYGPFLAECGDKFGTSNEYLLYNGAFILSGFEPQQQRVLTKNQSYWEPQCVHLDKIVQTYNAEAATVATTLYADGDIDYADISNDLLTAMMADPAYADEIHPSRDDTSYSYWYLFNFDANFDEEYEPENWELAVNNENFRLSIIRALNRLPALAAQDPLDPASFMSNTITPAGFTAASKDFTAYGDLSRYTNDYYYSTDEALSYKAKAVQELTADGASFPVKVMLLYNPTSPSWTNESQVVEQTLETTLGADYIDVIPVAGPETGFLSERRAGKYALQKCNWGADYADPETWTDPFVTDSSYSFIFKSEDPDTQALFAQYESLVNAAKAITNDMEARFEAFAKAESFLLEHGFALPIHTSARGYQMSRLNLFEGQYSSFGMANLRYKDQRLYEDSMNLEQFQTAYAQWKANLG